MPRLRTYEIKDAKLGSTPLGAVYKGDTKIWQAKPVDPDDIEITVDNSYWARGDGTNCIDMADWINHFNGTHNITDPGREISFEARQSPSGTWIGTGFQPDTFTQPNIIFVVTGTMVTCVDGDEYPSISAPFVRVQFKLSNGTITEWAYSP
jgi:hypothetical protein